MSRIDSPLTNAPITIARSGSVRKTFVLHGNSLDTNGSAACLTCGDLHLQLRLERLHPAGAKAVEQPVLVVAQPALMRWPALITSPAKPGVELVLDRPLNNQSRAEPGQLRQRLTRVLAHPHSQQLIDLSLDLRRRRYGTSHGVGPPSIVWQDLSEPTPPP